MALSGAYRRSYDARNDALVTTLVTTLSSGVKGQGMKIEPLSGEDAVWCGRAVFGRTSPLPLPYVDKVRPTASTFAFGGTQRGKPRGGNRAFGGNPEGG